jgi:hypothetical protein
MAGDEEAVAGHASGDRDEEAMTGRASGDGGEEAAAGGCASGDRHLETLQGVDGDGGQRRFEPRAAECASNETGGGSTRGWCALL